MSKNYEITDIAHPQDTKLHRIRALKALRHDVFPGDLGGFVQSEENLTQDEECWIYGDAIACENSCVAQKGRRLTGLAGVEHRTASSRKRNQLSSRKNHRTDRQPIRRVQRKWT